MDLFILVSIHTFILAFYYLSVIKSLSSIPKCCCVFF